MNITFKEENIDRAHRIGKSYKDITSGKITQSIIVKFKDWKSHQEFYNARPKYFVNGKKKPSAKKSFALIDTNCSLALKI